MGSDLAKRYAAWNLLGQRIMKNKRFNSIVSTKYVIHKS